MRGVSEVLSAHVRNEGRRDAIALEIEKLAHEHVSQIVNARTKIVLEEMRGNWLQRSWRPVLMFVLMLLLINDYLIFPWYSQIVHGTFDTLEFPALFWYVILLTMVGSVGGEVSQALISNILLLLEKKRAKDSSLGLTTGKPREE